MIRSRGPGQPFVMVYLLHKETLLMVSFYLASR